MDPTIRLRRKSKKSCQKYTKYHIPDCVHPTLPAPNQKMDLFAFIRHSDPTKVLVGERETAEGEVKLLTLTKGRTVSLDPPTSAALGGSSDNIDKLFDEGNDARQEHTIERGDDDSEETIAKDVLEVAVEKTKKKWKRKAIGDASGSTLPPKKLREDYHAATSNVGGKSLAAICGLISNGSFVPSGVTEPLVVASVTPTPDGGYDGPTDSVSRLNLRTRPPGARYVASLDDSYYSGSCSEVNSFARSLTADASMMTVAVTTTIAAVLTPNVKAGANVAGTSKLNEPATLSYSFYASQDLDSKTLHNIYVPKWMMTNDSVLNDPYVCHDLTDRLAPPALFSQLRAMYYDQLYTEFNVGVARQMCLGVEVRSRAEHTLEQKDRHEDKCVEQTALLLEKDAKIAHLKSLLSLREAEAAEAIRLRCQLSVVEAADAAKGNELRDLKERNFALEGEKYVLSEKVTTLESVTALKETELASLTAQVVQLTSDLSGFQLSRDELKVIVRVCIRALKGHMEAMQDEQETVLGNRVAELDAQLLEMGDHLEEEIYPRFLTAISGWRCAINKGIQDGLKARVDHGKAGRDLSVIEAYDPFAEAKYVDAVSALRIVDFSLLSMLKSKNMRASLISWILSVWRDH
ncbi:hypothetical protein Tco_0555673 [Tanacetum coccineum]